MQRPNQSAKTECCSGEGQEDASLEGASSRTTQEKRTQGTWRAASGSRTSLKQSSADTQFNADGEDVLSPAPETERAASGEALEGLPASESVANQEKVCGNLGGPSASGRSNCENQSGREAQRQGEPTTSMEGIRSAHSSSRQSRVIGTDADEGADTKTVPAKETSAVRTTDQDWRTSLRAIAKKAVQEKKHRFGGLYRMLNYQALETCFYQLRKDAACGVDGVTFRQYEEELESNLKGLVERLKNKGYRAKLVRRQYIPKENGKMRPLGIPALEDKLVQLAVAEILLAIYEADFLPCSYGYRPNRGAKGAVRDLTDALHHGRYEFVVEADIKGFFDHIEHDWMLQMLGQRISDGAMLGLIRKWLKAGILEPEGQVLKPESGTPQGGIVSPVLANVYLHYVLDLWFEHKVRKVNRGTSRLFRYADDFVACFDYRHEAPEFEKALAERLRKFGLELATDKTKTLRFGRCGGQSNGRFDFLGFEFRWEKGMKGWLVIKRRTSAKKLRSALVRLTEWIKGHRSIKVSKIMGTLRRKFQGHWNYYGVIGNSQSLSTYHHRACRIVFKWLNRRSQKTSYTWDAFNRLLQRFAVPPPRITEARTGRPEEPCQTGSMGWQMLLRLTRVDERYWKFS